MIPGPRNVKKAFFKFMNNAPYGTTIENVVRRTDIQIVNDMEKARKLTEKPHCVVFRVFDGQLAPTEEQMEIVVAEEEQQQKALLELRCESSITSLTSCSPTASASWSIAS